MQTSRENVPITIANGDGIGPEIMDATMRILLAAGAAIAPEEIEVGEPVYLRGHTSGIEGSAWESLLRTKVFLKAPITTPQGGGFKSMNVTIRKTLGLYANVRPAVAYDPYVATKHAGMDVVIIRENEEDLYAGIEYQPTAGMTESLKLISHAGSERICRYAFEYARRFGRGKVTCFTKDNIMKLTDGMFHRVFDEVAVDYPDIENEHWIVDIGMAKLADTPEVFDVIVTPNLYGDILSDIAAQIAGSVGLAGSANVGTDYAMFEAIHGSAPRRAGQNLANPSGLLNGALLMLVHIGQSDVAARVRDAWLATIEDGIHTYDVFSTGHSTAKVGTREFADAVIDRIGRKPSHYQPAHFGESSSRRPARAQPTAQPKKRLVGVDVFLDWGGGIPARLAEQVGPLANEFDLSLIDNRGLKVWPGDAGIAHLSNHWRCRYECSDATHAQVAELLSGFAAAGIDFVKAANLYTYDGLIGYSLSQGQ